MTAHAGLDTIGREWGCSQAFVHSLLSSIPRGLVRSKQVNSIAYSYVPGSKASEAFLKTFFLPYAFASASSPMIIIFFFLHPLLKEKEPIPHS